MELLRQIYPTIGLAVLCGLFGKSRQAYYELEKRRENRIMEHLIVLDLVEQIRRDMPRIGTPKLHHMLHEPFSQHNIKMGRDALNELLAAHGMLIRKKRRRCKTTNAVHRYRKYENLTENLELTGSEQLWVSDITYIRLEEGFSYLNLLTDAYSRMIIGYDLYPTLASSGTISALQMAIGTREYATQRLIHHSDRGVQYCCDDYVSILNREQILISMTKNGDPYQNAKAERVNGILKDEFNLDRKFVCHLEAKEAVEGAIKIYNYRRPHASCDYLTPVQAHERQGNLKQRWKNYKSYDINLQD